VLQCEIYIKCDRDSLVQRVDEIASHLALQVCVCVVVCCRVLQCVAGYCSVLQSETYMKYDRDSLEQCAGCCVACVAGCCRVLQCDGRLARILCCGCVCCDVLQCVVAVCCRVLQCDEEIVSHLDSRESSNGSSSVSLNKFLPHNLATHPLSFLLNNPRNQSMNTNEISF